MVQRATEDCKYEKILLNSKDWNYIDTLSIGSIGKMKDYTYNYQTNTNLISIREPKKEEYQLTWREKLPCANIPKFRAHQYDSDQAYFNQYQHDQDSRRLQNERRFARQ